MPRQVSIQLTEATLNQIEHLQERGFGTRTDIVRLAIDRMAREENTMDYSGHVQEYMGTEGTRCVIATWNEASGQWQASMNPEARLATGCHTLYAQRLEEINKADCCTYKTRAAALKAAERLANPS